MLPLKCFASVAGWAQDSPPSLTPHIRWFAAPSFVAARPRVRSNSQKNQLADVGLSVEFTNGKRPGVRVR
jgi:hypothetical protein